MKTCSNCQNLNHLKASRCRHCNVLFPEGQRLVQIRKEQKENLRGKEAIWNASASLYVIGILIGVVGLIFTILEIIYNYSLLLYSPLVVAFVFIGLGVWSKKNEFYAILLGAIIYSLLFLMFLLVSGFSVISFLLFAPCGVYLFRALFKIKRNKKTLSSDILDA